MAPQQKPGKSKQDYCTPPQFLAALKRRLGIDDFTIDLAATAKNAVAPIFYDEEMDSLTQPWRLGAGWAFCNPPFGHLERWVAKAFIEADNNGAQTAMLVPASTGSNWWHDWVDGCAYITFLNGRIKFVGADGPYPKDCAILLFAPFLHGGSCIWSWKEDVPR